MKITQTVLFVALVSLSFTGFSQNPITVNVSPSPRSADTHRSFVVIIPQTVLKEVKTDWLKYLSHGSKGKATDIKGVILQNIAVNENISAAPFNVYSKLIATTAGVRLNVWLDEPGISKEPNSGQHLAVHKYVYDFAVQQYRAAVEKELKAEQAKQNTLENNLARYIKGEEKSTKTLNENVRSTERVYDAIITNNSDIENSTEKIIDQKENIESYASDPNAAKGAKKTLSELEAEKKDLQKQNEAQNKKVDRKNKDNRAEFRSMETSQENQANTTAALEKQKQVVRNVQVKLDNIR